MTGAEIVTAISSVGFPIIACFALYALITRELKQVTTAIQNNTQAITALLEHMRKEGGNDERKADRNYK